MGAEFREPKPLSDGYASEAWRRIKSKPQPQSSGAGYTVNLKEPLPAGGKSNRESAASGGIVNLQEIKMDSTVVNLKMREAYARVGLSPNGTPVSAGERKARMVEAFKGLGFSDESARRAAEGRDGAPSNATETHARMTEAFKRLGYSDDAAKLAAQGRDGHHVGNAPADLRETIHRLRDADDIQPGSVIVYHPTQEQLRESERFAEQREAELRSREATQAGIAANFERMGLSPEAAKLAAKGRGY